MAAARRAAAVWDQMAAQFSKKGVNSESVAAVARGRCAALLACTGPLPAVSPAVGGLGSGLRVSQERMHSSTRV